MIITKKIVTLKDLDKMIILKTDEKTGKPKIWTDGKMTYKKDDTKRISSLKDYFEYYSLFEEFENCEFPKEILYLEVATGDYREYGYTDNYYSDYNCLGIRPNKKILSLKEKKLIIYEFINLVRNMHNNGFTHGDIHMWNLLRKDLNIKLIDFVKAKFKENIGEQKFDSAVANEIYYMNLMVLSILFDIPMTSIMQEEYNLFIDSVDFPSEYKSYLLDSLNFKKSILYNYPDEYIKYIKKGTIEKGKKLVNSLQL